VSERTGTGWTFPEALEIEDYYNDTNIAMMTVSVPEDIIVFSLKRKDGKGNNDLYVSKNLGGKKWSAPQPIVALNTPGSEISPFIAYDNHTMYFSTDGLGGIGLHDVFMTRRLDDTWMNWTEPVNLGEPVNTPSFDAYFMLTAKGDTAYFSSVHESKTRGYGRSDIWKLGLPQRNRPGFNLPNGEADNAVTEKDINGSLFRLDNVFFDVDKSSLRGESRVALDKLVLMMKTYPNVRIEVQGHTDADGAADHNLKLSQDRAASVRKYLIDAGISGDRVQAKGYGMTLPIAPNTTAEGKQLNRRVMIQIL
jgi:outer membrane protein OmpA-like peptidoglycan-associated protein